MKWFLITIMMGCLFSCRWGGYEKEVAVVELQRNSLGCPQFETQFWDALDSYIVSEKRVPKVAVFKDQIKDFAKKGFISSASKDAWIRLEEILFDEAVPQEGLDSPAKLRMFFAAMEVGDESTEVRKSYKQKIFSQLKELKSSVQGKICLAEENVNLPTVFSKATPGVSQAEMGMRWLFSTAYQRCDATQRPPMNEASHPVRGILDQGIHVDGIGHQRHIGNLSEVLASHYYYQGKAQGPNCRNEGAGPLIYDYGGKPFSSDGPEAMGPSSLDLFTNDGTGTEVLGIDCAAAIFSATATVGFRLKPDVPLRARNVLGINSRMFKDPGHNGLECYVPITLGDHPPILSGDIAAVNGHVLMIGEVGKDPFGLRSYRSKQECDEVEAENFDFNIWQSSSQKGGIGFNHIEAKSYLKDPGKMREGFEAYAKMACRAHFEKKEVEPQLEKFTIIRHNSSVHCQTQRIALKGEECIQDCPQIF